MTSNKSVPEHKNIGRIGDYNQSSADLTFFNKHKMSYLPPIYCDRARTIESQYGVNFTKAWGCETKSLLDELSVEETVGDIPDYTGGRRMFQHSLPGASSKIGEIYRTAFLRTLAWYYLEDRIPESVFTELSLYTCPVDLSNWEIQNSVPPRWWPQVPFIDPKSDTKNEIVGISRWSSMRNLVKLDTHDSSGTTRRLLAAEGACLWTDNREDPTVSFSLIPFAYKLHGSILPSPKQIANRLIWGSQWSPDSMSSFPLSVYDSASEIRWTVEESEWQESDLSLVSIVTRLGAVSGDQWLWYRRYRPPWGLAHLLLEEGCKLNHDATSWFFGLASRKVAVGTHWKIGNLERHDPGYALPCGQYLDVEAHWLDEVLDRAGLRLAHVLQVRVLFRKQSYDEPKTHTHNEFLGLSPIIT